MADLAAAIPAAERIAPRGVAFEAASMEAVIGWVNTVSALSGTLR
jgi:D-amino peptidase